MPFNWNFTINFKNLVISDVDWYQTQVVEKRVEVRRFWSIEVYSIFNNLLR